MPDAITKDQKSDTPADLIARWRNQARLFRELAESTPPDCMDLRDTAGCCAELAENCARQLEAILSTAPAPHSPQ